MISMTGPPILAHSADDSQDRQAVSCGCGIDNTNSAPLHRLVKWRNQILALFCFFVFAGLGVLYFQHWVIQKPFGIILFIGEGLAPDRLAATRLYIGGADAHLAVDSLNHLALMTNHSTDF